MCCTLLAKNTGRKIT